MLFALDVVFVNLLVDVDVLVGLLDKLELVMHLAEFSRNLALLRWNFVRRGALLLLVNSFNLSGEDEIVLLLVI